MQNSLYHYKAHVTDVYDGDTCTVDIDLGLHLTVKGEKVRLHRINAPELKGSEKEKGIKARDFLREQILDKDIMLETIKDRLEKYGRYLGEIHIEAEPGKFVNVNDLIVQNGFAVYKEY